MTIHEPKICFPLAEKSHKLTNYVNDLHKAQYPTPSASCPVSPLFKPQLKVSKRKSIPKRSVISPSTKEEKFLQGIVKLDVFKEYLQNPRLLANPKREKEMKFDFSRYKNTVGAPIVVWKKGIDLLY